MNRIYQGRVTKVQIPQKGVTKPKSPEDWQDLADDPQEARRLGEEALWKHHELFQDAVNYYTLCLAAMAGGMDEPDFEVVAQKVAEESARRDPKHKTDAAREKAVADASQTAEAMITAVKAWREAVERTWGEGERYGKKIAGGYASVAPYLGVLVANKPDANSVFATCETAALVGSKATKQQQAAALLQLLEEADGGDLSVLVNDRLGWFCSPKGKSDKTPKSMASAQEAERQRLAREFRDLPDEDALARAATLNLGVFVTTPPKNEVEGEEAAATLRKYWTKAVEAYPEISKASDRLDAIAPDTKKKAADADLKSSSGENLKIPALGRKPSGLYPVAAVFRYVPCAETLAAFRAATASLCKAKDKQVSDDRIADSRVDDTPHFAYFTNLAFHREADAKEQAAWIQFDNAALVEAVKSPHRYYQDTQARLAAASALEQDIAAMEGEGRAGGTDEGEGGQHGLDGFAGDARLDRLVAVLHSDLGHLGEVDSPDDNDMARDFITKTIDRVGITVPENSREYTLRERTLRSWRAVRDAWRDIAEKKKEVLTAQDLWDVVAKEQGEHRADFGSARFYEALTEPANWCIWREKGVRDYHADDLISAWAEYTELRRELRDKCRAIRFTPAHPKESPRFFNFPKKGSKKKKGEKKKSASGGKWASRHEPATGTDAPGMLAFTAGIAIRDGAKWRPVMTRITYRAPRLRRDEMRRDGETETNLSSAPWLQPMVKALGLVEPPAQDFGNSRITLQAHAFEDKDGVERYDIQLSFPVEIQAEKLIAQLGKQALWTKRFNLTPDGEKFRESSLRRKHEKQPKEQPRPLEDLIQRFTFGSVDFGLHADSWAMHEVRLDGEFGTNKNGTPVPSRAITIGDEAPWRLATRELRKLRLQGNDVTVWRKRTEKDAGRKGEEKKSEFDWREELYGDTGRGASPKETAECFQIMSDLLGEAYAWEFVSREQKKPDDFREKAGVLFVEFSFPEQNDKLNIVARRAQARLARIARWRAGVAEESRRDGTLKELRQACGFEDKDGNLPALRPDGQPVGEQWIPMRIQDAAKNRDFVALAKEIRAEHQRMIVALPPLLVKIANRILPLRGCSWAWERVEDREKEGRLHGLEQSGPKIADVLLQGQRGLSIMRIEQIEELRRRFQSFNQAERRHYAAEQVLDGQMTSDMAKAWVRRDFTDPCADLLDRLEEIKTQRVNQSAHQIFAQVLGVRLAKPPADKKTLRLERDQHGVYEKIPGREPLDFVVIEDLSRYRATQGKSLQENGRLMKWCHRAVRNKLRQLCEPFGIPVLKVPPAYSSQFCARSGVIGFRAEDVTAGFETRAPWCLRLRVKEGEEETTEQREMRQLAADLHKAQKAMESKWRAKNGSGKPPKVTVLLPKQGGQIFIPIVAAKAHGNRLDGRVLDADLNAAVNIGLRAVADPRMWEFFPRLRTERISGEVRYKGRKGRKTQSCAAIGEEKPTEEKIALRAREKRKWKHDMKTLPELSFGELPSGSAARETRQPNYFRDFARIAEWDRVRIKDPVGDGNTEIVSAKALFGAMRSKQWKRCMAINAVRLRSWGIEPPPEWEFRKPQERDFDPDDNVPCNP